MEYIMDSYDKWNEIKKDVALVKEILTFKVREVYWLKLGHNIGY